LIWFDLILGGGRDVLSSANGRGLEERHGIGKCSSTSFKQNKENLKYENMNILISDVKCLNKFWIVKIISKLCTLKIRLDEQEY